MPTVTINGMSCQHCVASVTKAIMAIDGIKSVEVSLEKKEAAYTETKPVPAEKVKEAIRGIGFEAP